MTKLIKHTTIVTVVLLALIGTGGIVAFASGYITWDGREDYEGAVEDLEGLDARRLEIVTNLDEARELITGQNRLIDSQKETITEKEDKITELENDNANHEAFEKLVKTELAKGINTVNATNGAGPKYREVIKFVNDGAEYLDINERLNDVNGAQKAEDQLEQAIKDMEDIKGRTGSLVEDFDKIDLIDIPEEDEEEN